MAHEHHGLAFTMAMKGVEHLGFAQAVEIRRRFVQQHERRIVQKDARQADALALAARKRRP